MPLKPITLVFGPNSAGKSSMIHSCLCLNHVMTTGQANVRYPIAAKNQVDLGGYNQSVHRHDLSRRMIVELSFPKQNLPESIQTFWNIESEVVLDISIGRISGSMDGLVQLVDYRLRIDGLDFITAIRTNDGIGISTIDLEHPAISGRIKQGSSETPPADIAVEYKLECLGLLPNGIRNDGQTKNDEFWDIILPKRIHELLETLAIMANEESASLSYIPPLRDLAPRYFDINEFDAVWQRLFQDEKLKKRVNAWLGKDTFKTKYELKVSEYYSASMLEREAPEFIRKQITDFLALHIKDDELLNEDLTRIFDELLRKYDHDTIETFLRSQKDLFEAVVQDEYDFISCDKTYWYEWYKYPGGKDTDELDETTVKEYISGSKLNWEAWVGHDCLGEGDQNAMELFKRWALKQPMMLEFIDQHTDLSASTSHFLKSCSNTSRDVRREIVLYDKSSRTEVTLQDVGVGISQVLPVILNAFGEHNRLIAIEQPEIHIHPALQADLGDVFIESALGENKNTFLLETHSEHLILRILRRIRETTRAKMDSWPEQLREACPDGIKPEDVAVLYVEPGEDGAKVRELRIDEQGRFIDEWPNGFFEERFNEEF